MEFQNFISFLDWEDYISKNISDLVCTFRQFFDYMINVAEFLFPLLYQLKYPLGHFFLPVDFWLSKEFLPSLPKKGKAKEAQ